MTTPNNIEAIAQQLVDLVTTYGRVAVAYSGGVDSTVVLRAAKEGQGSMAVGIIIDSPSLARRERDSALETASAMGVATVVLAGHEGENPRYQQNAPDRCYFCKDTAYHLIHDWCVTKGYDCMANGANADDAGDWRPGRKAADEWLVRSPLAELGLRKETVRDLARFWNLPVWDKPASPCLASRVPHGLPVTKEKLARIEAAEDWLRDRGYRDCRVRDWEHIARVEVPPTDFARLETDWPSLESFFLRLGYQAVESAGDGLQSGRLTRSFLVATGKSDEKRTP